MPATQLNGAIAADDVTIVVDSVDDFDQFIPPFAALIGTEPVTVVEGPPTSTTWRVIREAAVPPLALAHAMFAAVEDEGLGETDEGYTWRRDSDSANQTFDSDGEKGIVNFTAASENAAPYIDIPAAPRDVDTLVQFILPGLPVGATAEAGVTFRVSTSNSDQYRCRAIVNPDGTLDVRLAKNAATISTNLTSLTSTTFSLAAGEILYVRGQAFGTGPTTLRMKAWPQSQAEPASWQLSTTDSEAALQTAAQAGLRLTASTGMTSIPFPIWIDDVALHTVPPGTAWADNTAVTAIDPWPIATPQFVMGIGAPTAVAPEGSFYFDTAGTDLWVRARGTWYSVSLT